MRTLTTAVLCLFLALPAVADDGVDEGRQPPAETAARDAAQLAKDLKAKDYAVRLAAAEAAFAEQDAKLTAPLAKLLTDERFEVRAAVMKALGNRHDDAARKSAAKALAGRLSRLSKKPGDEVELLTAIEALDELRHPISIDALLDDIEVTTPEDVAKARLMAVANVRDKKAIDELIKFAARGGRKAMADQRRFAIAGLRYATGQDFRRDPDEWRAWWKENEDSFDFEAVAREREDKEAQRKQRKKRRKPEKGDAD